MEEKACSYSMRVKITKLGRMTHGEGELFQEKEMLPPLIKRKMTRHLGERGVKGNSPDVERWVKGNSPDVER